MKQLFMAHLKNALWPLHESIEKCAPLQSIVTQTITIDNYRELLKHLYGFILPLEVMIESTCAKRKNLFDFGKRKRASHLK
jgi:heme oxygenase